MSGRIHVDDLRFIGDRFREAREELDSRRVELVREAGYENINKGCRRLRHIERGEPPLADRSVLEQFARALGLDLEALLGRVAEREARRRQEERERHKLWVGTLLKRAREQKGFSVPETVDRAGLAPAQKYERRLRRLESGEYRFPMDDEFEALCDALEIPGLKALYALQKEFAYYDQLAKKPRVVARLMPAFYNRVRYPEDYNTDRILRFAAEFSADKGFRVCVTFADGRAVYVEPDGYRFESREGPKMRIG